MISLVITSNNILLSLPIAFTYHLFLPDYIFNIPNLIHQLLEISFFSLHCWNILAPYCIVEKRTNLSFYSPIFHLLGCNFLWFNSVEIWINSYSLTNCKLMTWPLIYSLAKLVVCEVTEKCFQSTQNSRPMKPPYEWWDVWLVGCNEYGFLIDRLPRLP